MYWINRETGRNHVYLRVYICCSFDEKNPPNQHRNHNRIKIHVRGRNCTVFSRLAISTEYEIQSHALFINWIQFWDWIKDFNMAFNKRHPSVLNEGGGCRLVVNFCLVGVFFFYPIRAFFTHLETSTLPVKGCTIWPMIGTYSHWAVIVL